jgi:hypothetical protein
MWPISDRSPATRIIAPLFDRAVQTVYRAHREAALRNISARRAAFAKVIR